MLMEEWGQMNDWLFIKNMIQNVICRRHVNLILNKQTPKYRISIIIGSPCRSWRVIIVRLFHVWQCNLLLVWSSLLFWCNSVGFRRISEDGIRNSLSLFNFFSGCFFQMTIAWLNSTVDNAYYVPAMIWNIHHIWDKSSFLMIQLVGWNGWFHGRQINWSKNMQHNTSEKQKILHKT